MSTPTKIHLLSEDEYLQSEARASVRHEYVGGHVFAMTGATDAHNIISGNIFSLIHGHLRDTPCRAYMNDMKVRIQSVKSFYYPDIMVSCEQVVADSVYKSAPVLLVEVLSPSTRQTDLREKLVAYQKIESLREYLIVHQDQQRTDLYRRTSDGGWELIVSTGLQDIVLESLPSGRFQIPFSRIYEHHDPPRRVKESNADYSVR